MDTSAAVVSLKRAIAWDPDEHVWFEKDTKTHQQRRVALDPVTVEVMVEHQERARARAESVGVDLDGEAFVFSPEPDSSTWLVPSSVTQRYDRMVGRLGIDTTLHKLRHYSATELISSGVDVRTVAGRLGPGSGGMTTLRVYSAWVSEADQRASAALASRVPERPKPTRRAERAKTDPKSPYEKLAAEIHAQVARGELSKGDQLPPMKELAKEHGVSVGTVQRAVQLLKVWGVVEASRGQRATVEAVPDAGDAGRPDEREVAGPSAEAALDRPEVFEFEVRRLGESARTFVAEADPTDTGQLRRLLAAAVRRDGRNLSEILDYEMDVRRRGGELLTTFVTMTA
ncbi:GntR family transcriptional regulator [Saccharopolyspora rosea]|uniref:GntR family transcriptional regulator n=1 Tax=Saccharopolyspora rosea TaxID=524884 RepID=UPI0021DA1062|nr:GntR family transcriptional regulator [Saccharopolyspora rosea]